MYVVGGTGGVRSAHLIFRYGCPSRSSTEDGNALGSGNPKVRIMGATARTGKERA